MNLNKKKKELNFDEIIAIFDSKKVAKGLVTSLSRFYKFVTITLKEILGEKEEKIGKNPKLSDLSAYMEEAEKNKDTVKHMKAYEFRAKIFEEVNKRYPGFVPPEEREKFIAEIEKKLNLPLGTIDLLFFSDLDSDKILIKKRDTTPEEAIKYYNYDVIETILSSALSTEIITTQLPGHILKNLIFISKINYIFTDINRTSEHYLIKIEPPIELFQEKGKWGVNIARVTTYFLRNALKLKLDFNLTAIVQYRNRRYFFSLNSNDLPSLPYKEIEDETNTEIDSKIEAQFQFSWKNMHGWEAKAETEPIIIDKEVIVPDFTLTRGKTKIYLEIVGYYTHKYIQKKKRKMRLLAQKGIPIIYLIDEELRSNFVDMRNIKAVYFSKNQIPTKELLKLLEHEYGDFEERIPAMIKALKEVCNEIKENKKPLSLKQIKEKVGAYTEKELKRVLSTPEAKEIISEGDIIYVPSFGFVNNESVKRLRSYLTKNNRVKYPELRDEFPELGEAIIPVCQLIGCRIKWKTFEEIEIFYRTNANG